MNQEKNQEKDKDTVSELANKLHPFGLRTVMELFDVGPGVAVGVLLTAFAILLTSVVYFFHSAPSTTITISTGPEGSVFQGYAQKYAQILESNGVKLNIVTSNGSFENLHRLKDPSSQVDVGIVQAGISTQNNDQLISLGSITYQPILIFYSGKPIELLSELAGKKIAIGPKGSGTRKFAIALLGANGIDEKKPGSTTLLEWEGKEAGDALMNHQIDAAFIMSEDAPAEILHNLIRSDEFHLYNFKQAGAYSRKIDYLNVLDLPEGAVDLGKDIPPHDVTLLGPMVELVAKKDLHPALSDLLLEAASQVHSKPGIFQKRGEFPTPIEHNIHLSEDASRFYKSGKSFWYRFLPFWLASLMSRIVVVFIPTLFILVPAVRSVPAFFRWRTQIKLRRRYRELLTLEQAFMESDPAHHEKLREEFDRIEEVVNKMKVRAAFADQFYGLRGHIDYVRGLFAKEQT